LKATHVVLGMLCVMYFITYVDRVNIGTAASEIQKELHLSNTQLGLVFSAFAYPYLLFQVIGGWVGDHFGPRRTLFWCGLIWAAAGIPGRGQSVAVSRRPVGRGRRGEGGGPGPVIRNGIWARRVRRWPLPSRGPG